MLPAALLVFTTALIGALWTTAQMVAASREWSSPAQVRAWTLRSALLYFGLVLVPLAAAGSGRLSRFDTVPFPMMGFFPYLVVVSVALARSRFGGLLARHLPLPALVGFHAFRILAELVIFSGVRAGLAPVALSFEGWNFDLVTGLSALPVAWWIRRGAPRWVPWAWNAMGLGFLAVIAFVAVTSFPSPLRLFLAEPSNEWVTHMPYSLLPGVLVVAALTGHLVIWRQLRGRA